MLVKVLQPITRPHFGLELVVFQLLGQGTITVAVYRLIVLRFRPPKLWIDVHLLLTLVYAPLPSRFAKRLS